MGVVKHVFLESTTTHIQLNTDLVRTLYRWRFGPSKGVKRGSVRFYVDPQTQELSTGLP